MQIRDVVAELLTCVRGHTCFMHFTLAENQKSAGRNTHTW